METLGHLVGLVYKSTKILQKKKGCQLAAFNYLETYKKLLLPFLFNENIIVGYTFTSFQVPFLNQIIPIIAINTSANVMDRNTPMAPQSKTSAARYANGN